MENKVLSELFLKERTNPQKRFTFIFAENLKGLRKDLHLTQKDVAKKLLIPVTTYSNWEQGRREPKVPDIFALMWAFDVQANELFEINESNKK